MTDKKSEWKAEFKSIGFNNQAKIHGFNRYELLTYIELWIQQAKQQGFAEALSMVEKELKNIKKERDSDLLASSATVKKVNWYNRALTDFQAIIHKMRGEI